MGLEATCPQPLGVSMGPSWLILSMPRVPRRAVPLFQKVLVVAVRRLAPSFLARRLDPVLGGVPDDVGVHGGLLWGRPCVSG